MTAQHEVLNGQSSSVRDDSTKITLRQDIVEEFPDPDTEPEAFQALIADKADATTEAAEDGKAKRPSKVKEGPSVTTQIERIAAEEYELGLSTSNDAFATKRGGPPIAQMLRGGPSALRAALANSYFERFGTVANTTALAGVMELLTHRASQTNERVELPMRVGESQGTLWLDLGRPNGGAVEITEGGWRVTRPAVIWRRNGVTSPLPDPVHGGSLADLWSFVNVAPGDRDLVIGWLLSMLFPGIPHPILAISGEQGSAKTTTGNFLKSIIDPSGSDFVRPPKDEDRWAHIVGTSWIVGVDNVSHIPDWWSDAMCRAVTGDGDISRKLYSDDDSIVRSFRRGLILNWISIGALRGDLGERLLNIEIQRITEDMRKEDSVVKAEFMSARPGILGGLLDLCVEVLKVLPQVHPAKLPRMADFARRLAAMDMVLGTKAFEAYAAKGDDLADEIVDGDEIGRTITELMASCPDGRWAGTASELLADLAGLVEHRSKYWPQSPKALSSSMKRLAPSLARMGILVEIGKSNGKRRIVLQEIRAISPEAPTVEIVDAEEEKSAPDEAQTDIDDLLTLRQAA